MFDRFFAYFCTLSKSSQFYYAFLESTVTKAKYNMDGSVRFFSLGTSQQQNLNIEEEKINKYFLDIINFLKIIYDNCIVFNMYSSSFIK